MKKIMTAVIAATLSASSLAANYSPQNGSNQSGTDTFRTRDGASCSQSLIGPSISTGVTGGMQIDDSHDSSSLTGSNQGRGVTAFFSVNIPLGAKLENRMNCQALFELEMEKLRLELEQLRKAQAQASTMFAEPQAAAAPVAATAPAATTTSSETIESLFASEPEGDGTATSESLDALKELMGK